MRCHDEISRNMSVVDTYPDVDIDREVFFFGLFLSHFQFHANKTSAQICNIFKLFAKFIYIIF